jgi:hypothetical protein
MGVSSVEVKFDPNSGCLVGVFDREDFAGGPDTLGEDIRLIVGGGRVSCVIDAT